MDTLPGRCARYACVLLALASLPVLAAEPPPQGADAAREWIARLSGGARQLEYQGVMVYAHDGRVEAMRVSRSLGARGPREEIVSLNGDPRLLVREQGRLVWTDPNGRSVEVSSGVLPLLGLDESRLGRASPSYRMRFDGNDRVAGLESTVVSADPADNTRYGYRLWVEPHTGMLLGSRLVDADGSTVQQAMFTSLTLGKASPARLLPERGAIPGAGVLPNDSRIGWMPDGFRMIGAPVRPDGTQHLLYSDGLAYVSVYIEQLRPGSAPMGGGMRRGALSVYARTMSDQQVVVVGDVPAATAEKIARSVEARPDTADSAGR